MSKTGVAAAVAVVAVGSSAIAEEIAKNACQEIGRGTHENLDDHAIGIVSASCRVE